MKLTLACWTSLTFLTGCASAQPATPAPSPATPPAATQTANTSGELSPQSSVDQILDALKARGDDLRSFVANVSLENIDPGLGNSSTQRGKVWYDNARAGGNARIRVVFDDTVEDGKIRKDKKEYLLDGGWLTERSYRTTNQIRRQVLAPGEKMNLLKLGEGPFPLPIGQSREEVLKQFDVTKVAAAKDDPAGTVHVRLAPKAGTRFAKQFKTIDVWVHVNTHFTSRIDVIDPNGISIKSTRLTEIKVNEPLADKDFALDPIDPKQWQQMEEAFQE